jgi:hypothetical protein
MSRAKARRQYYVKQNQLTRLDDSLDDSLLPALLYRTAYGKDTVPKISDDGKRHRG